VYVRRGWLYVGVDYCNSPLNNKNIDYHCPVFFSLDFHINHCVNCEFVVQFYTLFMFYFTFVA
jgi:hypothetical protein